MARSLTEPGSLVSRSQTLMEGTPSPEGRSPSGGVIQKRGRPSHQSRRRPPRLLSPPRSSTACSRSNPRTLSAPPDHQQGRGDLLPCSPCCSTPKRVGFRGRLWTSSQTSTLPVSIVSRRPFVRLDIRRPCH